MRSSIAAIFLILHAHGVFCQNLAQGTKAEGIIKVADDVTLEMARQKALKKAFAEALETAGVSFHVRSSTLSNTVESGDYFRDLFLVSSEISMQGNIVDYEITEDTKFIENNDLFYKIEIVADIIMYQTKPDEFFNITVGGLNREYAEGDKLTFNFMTTQDAYLYVFSFSNDTLSTLHPNPYEPTQVRPKHIPVGFPVSNRIDYEVHKEGEQSELIFIAVKERYDKLTNSRSMKDLLMTYNELEPFVKCIYLHRYWVK